MIAPLPARAADAGTSADELTVTRVYDEHVAFVWRNLRRLGVADASLDDATQDVFVVVHRRIGELDPERVRVRAWLFGILRRVAADHRRATQRRGAEPILHEPAAPDPGPDQRTLQAEAMRLVQAILDRLDDEKREVFVLAELEQMTAPEIAAAIGVPVNTVYSRLRTARAEFETHAAAGRTR